MKLFGYGDSWTEGVGVNRKMEDTFIKESDRKEYRTQFSWPKHLADNLSIEFKNNGIAGCSNKKIFDTIISDVKNGNIQKGDLVVILWSSSLRDEVSFYPEGEWFAWGKNYLDKKYIRDWALQFKLTKDAIYNHFLVDYKMFYVSNLLNQNYYNIVNQNYIIFLQKLFEHYNIKYVMADAFDHMVIDVKEEDDKTSYINKNNYWNFSTKTFKHHLSNLNNPLLWEDGLPFENTPGKHPSIAGYKEISDELHKFIFDINVLKESPKKIQYKIF